MPDTSKAIYATGRRKHAVARVWLQPGTGKFEGRDNGSRDPCIGSSGFGSSSAQPGHKC